MQEKSQSQEEESKSHWYNLSKNKTNTSIASLQNKIVFPGGKFSC